MSAPPAATERYDPTCHVASKFESGNEALDRWLIRYAGQSERRDAARSFVIADAGVVIGYYALLAGELDHQHATEQTRKGMSLSRHYPIPVAVLARLAVDHRHQHRGLGATLLRDALRRVTLASEQLAVRAVVVHAIDEPAARFYEHFGFRSLSATPRMLMVTLAELRAAGYP
ncbi:MAG TPA: GNAT family N-acetyltransferase [Solirubrobacteraceae bacterium]|nr:GNAT family N-acetyltransferase [Solirubrobacteraceae bacterium]